MRLGKNIILFLFKYIAEIIANFPFMENTNLKFSTTYLIFGSKSVHKPTIYGPKTYLIFRDKHFSQTLLISLLGMSSTGYAKILVKCMEKYIYLRTHKWKTTRDRMNVLSISNSHEFRHLVYHIFLHILF